MTFVLLTSKSIKMTAEKVLYRYRDDSRFPHMNIIVYPEQDVLEAMEEYARLKCLEAIRNVRHRACDIVNELGYDVQIGMTYYAALAHKIQNIPDQEVMPEL